MNKKISKIMPCHWVPLVCVFMILATFSLAVAQDVKGMLQQVNNELRQTQRDMFSGKNEKAVASLEGIKGLLVQVKEADPNNPGLKSAESKFARLTKDLERKTGKDLGGGTLTSADGSSKTELPPKPEAKELPEKPAAQPSQDKVSGAPEKQAGGPPPKTITASDAGTGAEKLPYHARRPIANAERNLQRVNGYVEKLKDPNFNADQVVKNMDAALEEARKDFEEGKAKAAEKGVTSHPNFDAIEAGIAEAEKKIESAKAGHAEAEAQGAARQEEVTADVRVLKDEYDRVRGL